MKTIPLDFQLTAGKLLLGLKITSASIKLYVQNNLLYVLNSDRRQISKSRERIGIRLVICIQRTEAIADNKWLF